ncbi:MAG TPA: FAD-dependent monooxygenase [Gemmatimonadaceae bacterium]
MSTSIEPRLDVAAIGGGIGGLTAAIALAHRGIETHVYESAPCLREEGAGLAVSPNAMEVLRRLDLAERVLAAGVPLERFELHDARSGLLQAAEFAGAARRHGSPTVAIHRRRLRDILAAEVPASHVHTGATCEGVAEKGGRVQVRFTGGDVVGADLVIGADGLRSTVREYVAPGRPTRYSGQTSLRAVAAFELPRELQRAAREIWAPRMRFGIVPIGPGEVYWYAAFDAPAGGTGRAVEEELPLKELCDTFPPPVATIVAATDPARIIRTDMYDLPPFRGWSRGRVALLGDAAHATTPNLGQGAAQAIEDAWVLADRIASVASVEEALRAYEEIRRPKAAFVVRRSWTIGRAAHLANPVGRAVRNLAMRWTPASATRRQYDRLFALNY